MTPELKALYAQGLQHFELLLTTLRDLDAKIDQSTKIDELADHEFVLHHLQILYDTMKKEIGRKNKRAILLTCAAWVHANSIEPIRTEYVTASPNVTVMPRLPSATAPQQKRDYLKFAQHFGLTFDATSYDLFRPNWKNFVLYMADLAKKGEPFPPGTQPDAHQEFSISHYKVRNITD